MMMMMMQESCLPVRHVLIWKKNSPTFSMGRLDYDYAHEPIQMTWLKKHKRPMLGIHKTSVWEIDKPRANKEHPTMKPVELYVNAYLNNSDPGDTTFEPYAGSGTALIASEQTGRKCCAIEISPAYVDVCVDRWEKFTGKKAKLAKV
jgi:DNA modification methylase